ncbi:unnamed protein product [Prorocentrum cordatum]|uniref:Pectate lyase superfamily protein domain-containing protein n=1 Tax=Prorocentrum cordatum TaxID=2364126 RepID=A0ABN9VQN5_9DINO|nr:unnamed protein product [Polarella glacialis]
MAPPRRSCGLPLLLPLGLACGRPPRAAAAAVSPAQLQARLQHAADSGAQAFTVPPGSYRFGAAPLRLRGARGLSIRAGGATLWFEVGGGLEISESENTSP